jgi:hypothetical protein
MADDQRAALADYIRRLPAGPFAGSARFELAAATPADQSAMRGLGTYGFIKGKPGFIIGAMQASPKDLEDFGYRLEDLILFATGLGLGTCWLGGTFTRSGFAHKIEATRAETLPAVCAVGPIDTQRARINPVRDRLDWKSLFFDGEFGTPLSQSAAGAYAEALEMVRIAPSASNKQPCRVLRRADGWHFYIQRTKGYREAAVGRITGIADMQRIDLGIGMQHFELACAAAGLAGKWENLDPRLPVPDALTEYAITWRPA